MGCQLRISLHIKQQGMRIFVDSQRVPNSHCIELDMYLFQALMQHGKYDHGSMNQIRQDDYVIAQDRPAYYDESEYKELCP